MNNAVISVTAWLVAAALTSLAIGYAFDLDYLKTFVGIIGIRMFLNLLLIGTWELVTGAKGGGSRTV